MRVEDKTKGQQTLEMRRPETDRDEGGPDGGQSERRGTSGQ